MNMIEQLTGIGAACVFFLLIGPGAYGLTLLIEKYIDSCPNRKDDK